MLALVFLSAALAAQSPLASPLVSAKRALAQRDFAQAKGLFGNILATQPANLDAQLGLADSELGLHQYLAAERDYRRVTAAEPQQWFAHKNLVIVEAALSRWEDFDREREVLRAARARQASGLSMQNSDVIDTLDISTKSGPQHWIVRDYASPLGRSATLYNFERFSPTGRVEAYVSLESATALQQELAPTASVPVGNTTPAPAATGFALDFYNGKSHGTIHTYPTQPSYERIRADFLHWTRTHTL